MKGMEFPESAVWTPILAVIVVALLVIAFMFYARLMFSLSSTGPVEIYSIEFVEIANKPFLISQVLAHTKLDDRPVLEQAIQMIVTSPERANADSLAPKIESFMKAYDMKFYRVKVKKGEEELLHIQTGEQTCGLDSKGWCVNQFTGCDVGRVKTDDIEEECSFNEICCKASPSEYTGYDMQSCDEEKGYCSEGEKETIYIGVPPVSIPWRLGPFCSEGQIGLGYKPECKDINEGKTIVCCGERTGDLEVTSGIATKATVPLLYKQKILGYFEVTAK